MSHPLLKKLGILLLSLLALWLGSRYLLPIALPFLLAALLALISEPLVRVLKAVCGFRTGQPPVSVSPSHC